MDDMKGKVVIITGAKSGIGLATAQLFGKSGASVALVDQHKPTEEAQQMIEEGYDAIAIRCNVTQEEEVKAMVDTTVEHFGKIDFAYNNAGIQSPITDVSQLSIDEYQEVMDTNLKSIWLCMKYELQQFNKQRTEGAIVNCSSLGGLVGIAGRSAYHASKHGVLGLTKSSALEYAAKGIRINAVCPGIIDTPMVGNMINNEKEAMEALIKDVPIGRLAKPEEVASVVYWLCGTGSTYVIGQAISVDGGYTIK